MSPSHPFDFAGASAGAGASAVQATERALSAITAWNPTVNAVLTVTDERARAQAVALDAAAARGIWCGPLHGMTLTVKDNIDWAGVRTTAASAALPDYVASASAAVVERLERNGAVIVGKANLHEWAFGPTSQSRHFGPVRNPWSLRHIAGGSSGGSAVAVATGMCAASIGSDTAGSIRMPSSFNGVVGLRPTAGRVSNRGAFPVSPPFDTLGPIARRVSDVALVFSVIAGHDPQDPLSADEPLPEFLSSLNAPIAGVRLGVMRRWYFDDVDPEVAAAAEAAIEVYRTLGVEIVEIDIAEIEHAQRMLTFGMVLADARQIHDEHLSRAPGDFGDDLHIRFRLGAAVTGVQYAAAMRWREAWRQRLRQVFGQVDAVLTPTTPVPAPLAEGLQYAEAIRAIPRFSCAWPMGGVPSLAVPSGLTRDGRPLSHEIAAAWFDEPMLFRIGHAFQRATDHHLRQPALTPSAPSP